MRARTRMRIGQSPRLVSGQSRVLDRAAPVQKQNVTSTSRVPARAQTGKARKPLRCPVITAWSVETGAGGPPMAMAVAANHALTRPGPTYFSKRVAPVGPPHAAAGHLSLPPPRFSLLWFCGSGVSVGRRRDRHGSRRADVCDFTPLVAQDTSRAARLPN